MATIVFRTISSIFYIGGLAMTGIGGWYDYQQTLTVPYGPFGLSILLWGIILIGLGSLLLIGQMWYKIWKLENPKAEIEVYPNYPVGKEIKLIVHNKTKVPVSYSATMTCQATSEPLPGIRALSLVNVSMGWESSGTYRQDIDPDAVQLLKLCTIDSLGDVGHKIHWVSFYKVESDALQLVKFMGHETILAIEAAIDINANLPIKGQRKWIFNVSLIPESSSLVITTKEPI